MSRVADADQDRGHDPTSPEDESIGTLLKQRTQLYSIARELLNNTPCDQKVRRVLEQTRQAFDDPRSVNAWFEVDKKIFGTKKEESGQVVRSLPISVDGRNRGRMVVTLPADYDVKESEADFLREVAKLASSAVTALDQEAALKESEERTKVRASKLEQEMWKRTEALSKKSGYLEGILRSSDDMIITTDLESRIVEFNYGAEQLLGYSAEEVQGTPITDLWVNPEERDELVKEVLTSGAIRNYETRLKTKAGDVREVSLTLSLLKDAEGNVIGTVGVSKDNTKEKAIIRELELLNRNFRETLHFINHEFKNSLLVIGGFVRRLVDTETDPKRLEQLKIIYHHSKFLEAMSLDFLVMAELEHGEFQVRKRPITDFYNEVILPAMIGLKERYPDSIESYDTTMGGVGNVHVSGDTNLLQIVFRNLFGNALKYRKPNGKIAYGVEKRDDHYLFNVWNEGPGVAPDKLEKIFEKFYRVSDETTREKRGTGLGLYNIRRIIESHGGRIWCETDPGHWVNFLFTLPRT